jgi:hypothetical protein
MQANKLLWTVILALPALAIAQTKPKITEMGWMAGHWTGTMQGATVDRYCSQPTGGSILCMMRVIAQNQAVWHEFSTLRETPTGIVLKTRFFNGDFAPDDPVETTLTLTKATATAIELDNPHGSQPKHELITSTGPDSMISHADLIDDKGVASAIDMKWTRVP